MAAIFIEFDYNFCVYNVPRETKRFIDIKSSVCSVRAHVKICSGAFGRVRARVRARSGTFGRVRARSGVF